MTNAHLNIGFVGGGNMAHAFVAGLLGAGHDPRRISVADPAEHQRARIIELNSDVRTSADNSTAVENADLVVLAVKPQIMADLIVDLRPARNPRALVVSIAAGIPLARLQDWFDAATPVVRVMPNQPALVGAGMSVLIANSACRQHHRDDAEYVTRAVGRSAWISDETLMDAVTAVSGSGPAYFYLLMEILTDWAHVSGLPYDLARLLTRQTALGAALSAQQSEHSVRELRESVTSPGGTTAAAVKILEDRELREILVEAFEAARQRSAELGTS